MLCIQFKRYSFKYLKACHVDNCTDKSLDDKLLSEENGTHHKKRKKHRQHAQRQVESRQLIDDDRYARGSVIYCVVGKQDAGYREAGQQCSGDNAQI